MKKEYKYNSIEDLWKVFKEDLKKFGMMGIIIAFAWSFFAMAVAGFFIGLVMACLIGEVACK